MRLADTSLAARGEMPVRLSNYGTDCPVINTDHLAQPGEVWVEVQWSFAGGSWHSIITHSNGDSRISISEPGFFDAGIADLSAPWNHSDGVAGTCEFQILAPNAITPPADAEPPSARNAPKAWFVSEKPPSQKIKLFCHFNLTIYWLHLKSKGLQLSTGQAATIARQAKT